MNRIPAALGLGLALSLMVASAASSAGAAASTSTPTPPLAPWETPRPTPSPTPTPTPTATPTPTPSPAPSSTPTAVSSATPSPSPTRSLAPWETPRPSPSPPPSPTVTPTPSAAPTPRSDPLPSCRYADVRAAVALYRTWAATLLDPIFRLPSSYVPPDLVPTSRAGLGGPYKVRSLVIADLRAMATDARKAGAPLAIVSAFRSHSMQTSVFGSWSRALGRYTALLVSARPGHSEHQLGTTIDFTSRGAGKPWSFGDWGRTKAGAWLARNAWKYGFIMSYPRGKTSTTCYRYEPWHYRYVGREAAAAVHASRLTLREWLWKFPGGP